MLCDSEYMHRGGRVRNVHSEAISTVDSGEVRNVSTTLGHFFFEFKLSPSSLLPRPALVD
jgi:hypothetical protein